MIVRGQQVVLDSDLAEFYAVETRRLMEQVKRNDERFPRDFVFQLTREEADSLRSQSAISKGSGGRRYRPYVFTEQGALQASSVLRSPRAAQVSVAISRAFVAMREQIAALQERSSGAGELAEAVADLKRDVEALKSGAEKQSKFQKRVLDALTHMEPFLKTVRENETSSIPGPKAGQLPSGKKPKGT